jgi:uncharacterized protein (TIGR03083 family)
MSLSTRRYVQAVYGLDAVAQRVGDSQWDAPSPCEAWVARDVLVHNAWSFELIVWMAEGRPVSVPPGEGGDVQTPTDDGFVFPTAVMDAYANLDAEFRADPLGAWSRARDRLVAVLDAPGVGAVRTRGPWGETDMDSWLKFGVWDPLVHTWDLAEAVGQVTAVDSGLCADALIQAQEHDRLHNLRRPFAVGDDREPENDTPLARLIAFAGRDPNWRTRRR